MKVLFIIWILFSMAISAYGQEIDIKKDSLFFPDSSFDCNGEHDLIGNNYWTGYLKMAQKKSLYKDNSFSESYRLIYWGNHFSIIELIKHDKFTVCVYDSMAWKRNELIRSIDTLYDETVLVELRNKTALLWGKRSYEKCSEEMDPDWPIMLDDSPVWVLEYKRNKKYKVMYRYNPDNDIQNVIDYLNVIQRLNSKRK